MEGVRPDELEFVRRSLTQSLVRAYESTAARLAFVNELAKYERPDDYPVHRLEWLQEMQADELRELANRHIHPDALVVVVVGDGRQVRAGLEGLAHELVELDAHGRRIDPTPAATRG